MQLRSGVSQERCSPGIPQDTVVPVFSIHWFWPSTNADHDMAATTGQPRACGRWHAGRGVYSKGSLCSGLEAQGPAPSATANMHNKVLLVPGVLQETSLGQPFEVDAVLHVDLREAGRSDELTHTLSYADAYK